MAKLVTPLFNGAALHADIDAEADWSHEAYEVEFPPGFTQFQVVEDELVGRGLELISEDECMWEYKPDGSLVAPCAQLRRKRIPTLASVGVLAVTFGLTGAAIANKSMPLLVAAA